MEPSSKKRLPHFWKASVILLFVTPAFIDLTLQGMNASWAGFRASLGDVLWSKTFWDWMDLLLIPLILAGGVLFLIHSRHKLGRRRLEDQAALKREFVRDHQQEEALQAYFDRMADLLLKDKLSRFSPDEVRIVARIRTLTVMRCLDAKRKGLVLLFLKDSGLIDREAVIDMSGADLSGTCAEFASLNRVNLSEADLSGADLNGANLGKSYLGGTNLSKARLVGANLSGADLFEADLRGADLTRAKLGKANLNGADLRGCRLNDADLSGADLSGVNLNVGDLVRASLRGANLGGAKLVGADLSDADLSLADLSGTQITQSELERVKSLEGAILPDGTKHE